MIVVLYELLHLYNKTFFRKLLGVFDDISTVEGGFVESLKRTNQCLDGLWIKKQPRFAWDNRVERAALAIGNHRRTSRHSFDGHNTKIFEWRKDKRLGFLEIIDNFLIVDAGFKFDRW